MSGSLGSSIPAALAFLEDQIRELQAVKAAQAEVSDGWPANRRDAMVVLALNPDQDTTGVSWEYASLGGEHEQVAMPCAIVVKRSGPKAGRAAREVAFAILDAIRDLVKQDRTLGGAICPGREARVVRAVMAPTSRAKQAGEGRVVEINWWVEWQHRLD